MLFEVIRKVSSSSEQGNVLRKSVDLIDSDSKVNQAFFSTVKSVSSSSEQGSILRSLVAKPKLDKITLLGIIDATQSISSNSEAGSVLEAVGKIMSKNDQELRNAYKSAASKLSSDSEYRKVMSLID